MAYAVSLHADRRPRRRSFKDVTMLSLLRDPVARTTVAIAYAPPTSRVAPELGRTFEEACHRETPRSAEDLHLATIAMVERLKADGLPPERVIVAIKAALVRYGGCHIPPSFDTDNERGIDERRAAIYRRLFTWCLDTYYAPTE